MFDKELLQTVVKRWGALGLIGFYFLWQDYQTRELDRQDRKDNITLVRTLVDKVNEVDNRMKIVETKLELRRGDN